MLEKICIISDTHFDAQNKLLFNTVDTENNFNLLIDQINKEQPTHIFVLGDISQDGSIESYIKAKNLLSKFKCKKYIIMGNHDSTNIIYMLNDNILMPDYLDIGRHRFIFLSSYKGGNAADGYVSKTEFEKIRHLHDKTKLNYLLVHHHFIKTNCIIDNYIMENYLEFSDFISKSDFKAVFHGHVHNGYDLKIKNTIIHALPSTCIQFGLYPSLILEPIIGYRMLYLMKDSYEQKIITKTIQ